MVPSFIFGEGQKARSPDELKKMRATLEALRGRSYAPKNIGEGLAAIGDALAYRMDMSALEKGEAASREAGKGIMSEIVGALGGGAGGSTGYGGGSVPASATGSVEPASVPQTADAQKLRQGMIDRGLPEHIADGFLMNFQDESGLNPGINEKNPTVAGSRGGYGLYQLTGPRRVAYEKYAASKGVSPDSPDAQLDFLMTELQGPESNAAKAIYASKNSGEAAAAIARDFLRPAKSHLDARVARYTAGGGTPAAMAIEQLAPTQVASLDPSVGGLPSPTGELTNDLVDRRQAISGNLLQKMPDQMQGRPGPETLTPVSQPMTPNQRIAQAFAPVQTENVTPKAGRVLPQNEQTQRIMGALLGKQPIGGEYAGMQPPEMTAAIPQPQPVAAPQPTAELPGTQVMGVGGAAGLTAPINGQGGQFPPAPGQDAQSAFPPAPTQPGQLDMNRLIELAADPNTPELGQMIVQTLLKQRLTPPDPMDALNRQKTELDIQKTQRDLDTPASRPMTTQERQQWGIPAEDTRPYAMTPKGPELIGGSGQTINIGGEVEARKAELSRLGIGPDDPRYAPYALTGKMPREDMQSLTATDKKAILEADEMVMTAQTALPILDQALKLSDTAYDGVGASQRGWLAGNLGFEGGKATMEFDNLIQTQALNQLKAIFGAAPTEGERKILLDIAGSSSLPADVRKGILERAKQAVDRRLTMYKSRAEELRGGTFYKPDGGQPSPQGNGYKDKYGLD